MSDITNRKTLLVLLYYFLTMEAYIRLFHGHHILLLAGYLAWEMKNDIAVEQCNVT